MIEKKRALIVTTVASTIDQFCMNDINILIEMGYEIDVAANFSNGNNTSNERIEEFKIELKQKKTILNEIDFNRNPVSLDNLTAYRNIDALLSSNCFELIHCHTPVAAMIVRIAARKSRGTGTKVIYTAHGFHFFKGAHLKNWMLFYPVERWLARYTDVLITINKEDYNRAKNFKARKVEYIPGVGIDVDKFNDIEVNKNLKRKELSLPEDSFVALSVGELNKNKNHEIVIRAFAKMNNPLIHYVICGQGVLESYLRDLAKELGLEKQVHLLGFRKDIAEICKVSDAFVFPSKREGLGLAAIEAMAVGLPIITSNLHGIVDYSIDGITGYTCNPQDVNGFVSALDKLIEDKELCSSFGKSNINVARKYDLDVVNEKMKRIYGGISNE